MSFKDCFLNKQSVENIINSLSSIIVNQTLIFNSNVINLFTEEEWNNLINSKSNWKILIEEGNN